jgi:hypothetical protein
MEVKNAFEAARSATAEYAQNLGQHDRDLASYQAEIGRVLNKYEADYQRVFTSWAGEQRQYLDKFGTDITEARDKFMGKIEIYRAGVTKNSEQAQLDQQRLSHLADLETDVSKYNALQASQIELADYQASLQQHERDIAELQASVDKDLTQFRSDFEKAVEPWKAEQTFHLDKFRSDTEINKAAIQAAVADYQREVDRVIRQAEITAQEASQTSQLATDVAIQNQAKDVETQVNQFQSALVRYREEINGFSAELRGTLEEIRIEAEVMANKLRMLQFDRNRLKEQYSEVAMSTMRYYNGHARKQGVFMHEY